MTNISLLQKHLVTRPTPSSDFPGRLFSPAAPHQQERADTQADERHQSSASVLFQARTPQLVISCGHMAPEHSLTAHTNRKDNQRKNSADSPLPRPAWGVVKCECEILADSNLFFAPSSHARALTLSLFSSLSFFKINK